MGASAPLAGARTGAVPRSTSVSAAWYEIAWLPGYFLTVATRAFAASDRLAYTLEPGPVLPALPGAAAAAAAGALPAADTTEGSGPPRFACSASLPCTAAASAAGALSTCNNDSVSVGVRSNTQAVR